MQKIHLSYKVAKGVTIFWFFNVMLHYITLHYNIYFSLNLSINLTNVESLFLCWYGYLVLNSSSYLFLQLDSCRQANKESTVKFANTHFCFYVEKL